MKLKLLASILAIGAGAAQATTLTFEGFSNAQYDNTTIVRSGFEIGNVAGDEQHFHEADSTQFGLTSNGTGILVNDRLTRLYLTRQDGADFSLGNFDAAWYTSTGSLTVSGFLNGSLTGSFTASLNNTAWQTLAGASLGTVDYLVFDGRIGNPDGFQLDNINLGAAAAVPEPESYALMLAGLAAVGVAARRRKATAA